MQLQYWILEGCIVRFKEFILKRENKKKKEIEDKKKWNGMKTLNTGKLKSSAI